MNVVTLVNGANNNVALGGTGISSPYNIVNGPSAPYSVSGIVAPTVSGVEVVLIFVNPQQLTITHLGGTSSAANRIVCPFGADMIFPPPPTGGYVVVRLRYVNNANPFVVGSNGGWIVLGSNTNYQTIEANGTPLTQRSNLNFIGLDLTDDAPGNDTQVYRHYEICEATQNGSGNQVLTSGVQTIMPFNAASLSSQGVPVGLPAFTSNVYTVGQTGIYKVTFMGTFTTVTASVTYTVSAFKNTSTAIGIAQDLLMTSTAGASYQMHYQGYVSCNANDTLQMNIFQISGSNATYTFKGSFWIQRKN